MARPGIRPNGVSIYSWKDNIPSNALFSNQRTSLDIIPTKKSFHQEIELTHDFEPLEATEGGSHKFKLQHGDKLYIPKLFKGPMAHEAQEGSSYLHPEVIQVL